MLDFSTNAAKGPKVLVEGHGGGGRLPENLPLIHRDIVTSITAFVSKNLYSESVSR